MLTVEKYAVISDVDIVTHYEQVDDSQVLQGEQVR